MRKPLQYNIDPVKYYSKVWKLPPKAVKEFCELYRLGRQIWKYQNFRRWFWLAYKFKLTYRKWYRFKNYYRVYEKRQSISLPPEAQITKTFIEDALKTD